MAEERDAIWKRHACVQPVDEHGLMIMMTFCVISKCQWVEAVSDRGLDGKDNYLVISFVDSTELKTTGRLTALSLNHGPVAECQFALVSEPDEGVDDVGAEVSGDV